jgi:glyoxylase-like metal-dependent hydrolase (beta-lactamase superfamily II)
MSKAVALGLGATIDMGARIAHRLAADQPSVAAEPTKVPVSPAQWYETIAFADGVTLIHEPWMPGFFRCNMWHVRGRDRDLLIDTGLGAIALRRHVPLLNGRPIVCVLSHSHFDHIGSAHEFEERWIHRAEAAILADPTPQKTLFAKYASDDPATEQQMFYRTPQGWRASAHAIAAAPATRLLDEASGIDLGDRFLRVLHTPGHSPGHVALFEERTGILFAQDAVYDGPLVDSCYHSDIDQYLATMTLLDQLEPSIVHAGHFASFGATRLNQLIAAYRSDKARSAAPPVASTTSRD